MASQFQKSVKAAVESAEAKVCVDAVTCRKDGTVLVRRSYFYTHGRTAESWANEVSADLTAAGIAHSAKGRDDYANWPKTSYFTAIISPA